MMTRMPIRSKIGGTVDVSPFTPDYKPISVELVDAALRYECPYTGEIKILSSGEDCMSHQCLITYYHHLY